MSETTEDKNDHRDYILEVVAAIILGLATVLGAYAAYQSSLWGGNCVTAYNEGTNRLGEANRELLKGVQEQAFDTVIWLEQLKAQKVEAAEEEAFEEEDGEEEDEEEMTEGEEATGEEAAEEESTSTEAEMAAAQAYKEARAAEIVEDLLYAEDLTLTQKLDKLLSTRRELQDAIRWTNESYQKRMASLDDKKKLALALKIVGLESAQEDIVEKQFQLGIQMGLSEDEAWDDEILYDALGDKPELLKQYEELDTQWYALQSQIEAEYIKMSKPMFFESPEYTKKKERAYKKLQEEGQQLLQDGQKYNVWGDNFTLATVLFTITMFFAGLASVLRRFSIRLSFLTVSVVMLVYSTIQMFATPFA